MVLSVVGGIDPQEVFDIVERCVKPVKGEASERKFVKESAKPVKKYVEENLSVAQKQFLLGYKEDIAEPLLTLEDELASQVMLEAIAGKSSPLFKKLLDEEFIDMIVNFDKLKFEDYVNKKALSDYSKYGKEKTIVMFINK